MDEHGVMPWLPQWHYLPPGVAAFILRADLPGMGKWMTTVRPFPYSTWHRKMLEWPLPSRIERELYRKAASQAKEEAYEDLQYAVEFGTVNMQNRRQVARFLKEHYKLAKWAVR